MSFSQSKIPSKTKVLRIIGECKSGGTESIFMNYYRKINHSRISMDVLFYGESLPRFTEELGLYGDNVFNVVDYTDNLLTSIMQIRNIVQENNYDIVHAQLNTLNFFPLLGALLGGARIRLASNHSTANFKYERKKSILKYILRPTVKLTATHYAACSRHAGEWCFGKHNVENGRVKLIHNAINVSEFSYSDTVRKTVRAENNWEGKFIIGHIGRFMKQKNQAFIVDIFYEIHKQNPNAVLVFVGEGILRKEIQKLVHKKQLDRYVQFLTVRFDINQLMQGFDVFLFPSLYEGLGNVIIEAQAAALHCVVSNHVPEEVKITEYVDFLPLDVPVKKWADKVMEYSYEYGRRDTCQDLRKAGYDIAIEARKLEDYYASLAET